MSGANYIYGITAGDVTTLAPLVGYFGGRCHRYDAVKILEGLAAIQPSPPTITWLRAAMAHPDAFYGQWWTGEMSDTGKTGSSTSSWQGEYGRDTREGKSRIDDSERQEVHWISVYPRYLEQYVIVGGKASTPVVRGGKSMGTQLPGMLEYENKWKRAGTKDLCEWNVESAVLLSPVDIGYYVPRSELQRVRVKYFQVSGLEVDSDVVEMVTRLLRDLKSRYLTERQVRYITRDVVEYFPQRVVDYYLQGGRRALCRDFLDVLGYKVIVDALDKYGDRARLLLCPTGMLQHLLGWPVRCEVEGLWNECQRGLAEDDDVDIHERLQREVLEVLHDPQAFELGTMERNVKDAQVKVERLGKWAKVAEMDDYVLKHSPGDLVWGIQAGGEVYAVVGGHRQQRSGAELGKIAAHEVGGEEWEDSEMNYESEVREKRAIRDGLPVDPLPVLELIDLLSSPNFHRKRLEAGRWR